MAESLEVGAFVVGWVAVDVVEMVGAASVSLAVLAAQLFGEHSLSEGAVLSG